MITRVRMNEEQKRVEKWATELNFIYRFGNPNCARAIELSELLDNYWNDKPDWEEDELVA